MIKQHVSNNHRLKVWKFELSALYIYLYRSILKVIFHHNFLDNAIYSMRVHVYLRSVFFLFSLYSSSSTIKGS